MCGANAETQAPPFKRSARRGTGGCIKPALRPRSFWALLASCTVLACTPALNWREVRPTDAGVGVQLPCKPSVFARDLVLQGVTVRWHLQSCSADGSTWALAHGELSDPALVAPALHALHVAAQRNLGAEAAVSVSWSPPGATPNVQAKRVRMRGNLPDGRPMVQELVVFARGTSVYQASVLGPEVAPEATEVFFASLHVL